MRVALFGLAVALGGVVLMVAAPVQFLGLGILFTVGGAITTMAAMENIESWG